MSPYLLLWILVWTILAFALMGIDKWKAKREAWRVPEKVLFLSALAGGSIGALAGMAFFRHKTLHWSFRIGMPAILVLQVVLLALWSFRDLWWG